jgi:hypothetical protein
MIAFLPQALGGAAAGVKSGKGVKGVKGVRPEAGDGCRQPVVG